MSREYAKVRYSGQIDHGPRTCYWTAVCMVSRAPQSRVLGEVPSPVSLVEVEDLRLRVWVFSESLEEKIGEYGGIEVPDAEVRYWETYITGICRARVKRGEDLDDLNWESEE